MLGEKLREVDVSEIVKSYWESRGGREMLERWWRDAGREVDEGEMLVGS